MQKRSRAPRLSILSTLAQACLGAGLLAGMLGFSPAAAALAQSPEPYLVKDIYPGLMGSDPIYLTAIGNEVYFAAIDEPHGDELWKSDGTAAGTLLVKDIYPGQFNSHPENLTAVNGRLFFTANDGISGDELWQSDGTETGTVLVKDIYPGSGSSNPQDLTDVNGTLFFIASDETHGAELWKSDGTPAGTVLVKDIQPGANGSDTTFLTAMDGTLFFFADDGAHGNELWKSDGTEEGTTLIKDIAPGSYGSRTGYFTQGMAVMNGSVYFFANDSTYGFELWKSDGSEAGTTLVKDINPGGASSVWYYYAAMAVMNDTLYFNADDGTHGIELWKSDGTQAGTELVKDIYPGINGSFGNASSYMVGMNGTLYFNADDGSHGDELWRSDGTEAGTTLVKDINPGSNGSYPQDLTDVNGTLYFVANDDPYGDELWQSDGTEAGTTLVRDIYPGEHQFRTALFDQRKWKALFQRLEL